jgi:tetratricopeptide (TPR) repeat protein
VEPALSDAIALRESGRDQEAREILLVLHASFPDDPVVNYQCAWVHDKLGLEVEAIPFYVNAIEKGLLGDDLRGALLGLGSTYRAVGRYEEAVATLRSGVETFPEAGEFPVFLAMALHNTGRHQESVSLLLKSLAGNSADQGVQRFRDAILFYADHLDETW